MKNLLAILILTLVLAVHSYVLDGRLSARGPDDNNNDNDEDERGECEPILGFVTGYSAANCINGVNSLRVVTEEQDVCGNSIVLDTCTNFVDDSFSYRLDRASNSVFCILYTDTACTAQYATLRANDGDENGTCINVPVTLIFSIKCFGNTDK